MAIIRDQVEFLHVLEDTCGITSDNLGEKFECELSSKMVDKEKMRTYQTMFFSLS